VCLGVWLAISAEDIGGKILGIFFPITAFVAMGFDHVVANMFFLPAAIFAHVPGMTWAHALNNIFFALIGNIVGAVLFVALAYWYLYLRGAPSDRTAGAENAQGGSGGYGDNYGAGAERDDRSGARAGAVSSGASRIGASGDGRSQRR